MEALPPALGFILCTCSVVTGGHVVTSPSCRLHGTEAQELRLRVQTNMAERNIPVGFDPFGRFR
jgi:hypothetical protein